MTSILRPGFPTRTIELFIYFLGCFPPPSPSIIHPLHIRDLFTKDFATPNFPPIYDKPVETYAPHAVVFLSPLSTIRLRVLRL